MNETLQGVVIGGLIGVLGGLVSSWASFRHADTSWLRDARFRAYSEFLTAVDAVAKELGRVTLVEDEALSPEIQGLFDLALGAGQRAKLVAPPDTDILITELLGQMIFAVRAPDDVRPEAYRLARVAVFEASRRDLGTPQLHALVERLRLRRGR